MKNLQNNFTELTQREKQLSDAKIKLGEKRMEFQRLRHQVLQSKCSLCRIGAQNQEIFELDPLNDITSDIEAKNSFQKENNVFKPDLFSVDNILAQETNSNTAYPNSFLLSQEWCVDDEIKRNDSSFTKAILDPSLMLMRLNLCSYNDFE